MHGLEKITHVHGMVVTDDHRQAAAELTRCEALECMDAAVQAMSGSAMRNGGTLIVVLNKFRDQRGVIQSEMDGIAARNLTAVVTNNPALARIMSRGVEFHTAPMSAPLPDVAPNTEMQQ